MRVSLLPLIGKGEDSQAALTEGESERGGNGLRSWLLARGLVSGFLHGPAASCCDWVLLEVGNDLWAVHSFVFWGDMPQGAGTGFSLLSSLIPALVGGWKDVWSSEEGRETEPHLVHSSC